MYNNFSKGIIISLCMSAVTMTVDANECVLQERATTQTTAVIAERTNIKSAVVPFGNGQKKCIVDYRARIGNEWFTAYGEYVWDGSNSSHDACAVAVKQADTDLIRRVKPTGMISEQVLMCNDNPDREEMINTNVGSIVKTSQLRPYPAHLGTFMYKGSKCKWFLDTVFKSNDVYNYTGIACSIGNDNWVIVDKF